MISKCNVTHTILLLFCAPWGPGRWTLFHATILVVAVVEQSKGVQISGEDAALKAH